MKTGCLCKKEITKEEVARKIFEVDLELNGWIDRFDRPKSSKELFNGTVFAVFKDAVEYESYLEKFPQNIISKILLRLKYYLFGCCMRERTLEYTRQAMEFTVQSAPEPNDTKWENLEITTNMRRWRNIQIFFIVLLILGASFAALLGISIGQKNIKVDNGPVKIVVSILFASVTSLFNFIIQKILISITHIEKPISQTEYLLSLSMKLTVFTFLNSAPVPVVASYISQRLDSTISTNSFVDPQIIASNALMIFIVNSLFNPLYYLSNVFNILRYFQRSSIHKKLNKNDPNFHINDYTQGEINK